MVGAGLNVFAVWGYIITKAKHGFIEINPKLLAFTLGGSEEEVQKALNFLQEPDLNSRSKSEGGRRLVKEGQFQYRIVNWQIYDEIKNEIERRDYNRVRQQQFRDRKQAAPKPPNNPEEEVKPPPDKPPTISPAMQVYDAYPRKLARGDALKAIEKALKKMEFEKLLAVTQAYAAAMQGEDFKFVSYPASWFNAEHYFDDPAMWKCKPGENNGTATVFEMKTVLEAKEKAVQTLKNQHATETALGMEWDSDESMLAHKKLRIEIKQLAAKLSAKL